MSGSWKVPQARISKFFPLNLSQLIHRIYELKKVEVTTTEIHNALLPMRSVMFVVSVLIFSDC